MIRTWRNPFAEAARTAFYLILGSISGFAQGQAGSAATSKPQSSESPRSALISQYCSGCHNEKVKSGGMSLTALDLAHPERNAELAEKMIRKLNAGLMPPVGARRPDAAALKDLAGYLETQIDKAAANRLSPGRRPFQRLTRTEYARSIHDLLDIDEDVSGLLPPDSLSAGFDNIADSQAFSPALMEGYIRAAAKISRDALGDPSADATSVTFKIPRTSNQLRHVDGAPLGTRGGISVVHNFPADGNYSFRVLFYDSPEGQLFGRVYPGEQIEISINGERVALLDIPLDLSENGPVGLTIQTAPIAVKAGPQRVSAAFIQRTSLLVDDLIAPIEYTLADATIGNLPEITTLSHLKDFEILGPTRVTGISDTPSRRRVFKCRPLTAAEELPCATKIISDLARQAYRRPISAEDLEGLLTFYESGRKSGDFESGIRLSLEALLASPNFVFRFEKVPATAKSGQSFRVDDLELASRLSYFLWSTAPDDELINVASQGKLKEPAVLEKEVRRMLADPRSETLATKFAAEWFHLADLANMQSDPVLYPQFDHTLAESMRRETELFFDSIIREDRSILDLLTANYTFVDERLAQHYSVPDVLGSRFRRIEIQDPRRRGLLGQGSILVLTSHADRTSPVLRGKWVMDVLLGTPPPPPPPNVPDLAQTKTVDNGKQLSVRERMEIHRASASCSSCHRMIDPIGLALENFDPTGLWRIRDNDSLVDSNTQLWDGTKVDSPEGLRQAILNHSDAFIYNFTERLTTYALGRRVDYRDMPLIRSIARDAARNNERASAFILGIVKSPAFQMSTAEGTQQ
jgi:mono/diheme cytochrome c family protein